MGIRRINYFEFMSLDSLIFQGYGLNRLGCDHFIVIDEELPLSTWFMKDAMNVAYLIHSRNVYHLNQLSHRYNANNKRIWKKKCVVVDTDRFQSCRGLYFSFDHKHHLNGLNYRYVVVYLYGYEVNGLPVYIQVEVKNATTLEYRLVEGVDFHSLKLLQRRFGFNLVILPAFHVRLFHFTLTY